MNKLKNLCPSCLLGNRWRARKIKNREGTTLVEMLIALSVFVIFIAVAVGGFLQALSNQRVALKLMAATDNLSLTLEQMNREMRVGTKFIVLLNGIQFERSDGEADNSGGKQILVRYYLEGNKIVRHSEVVGDNDPGKTGAITAENVRVDYFSVNVVHDNNPGPYLVSVVLGVTAQDKSLEVTNYIQSTISSRLFSSD